MLDVVVHTWHRVQKLVVIFEYNTKDQNNYPFVKGDPYLLFEKQKAEHAPFHACIKCKPKVQVLYKYQ